MVSYYIRELFIENYVNFMIEKSSEPLVYPKIALREGKQLPVGGNEEERYGQHDILSLWYTNIVCRKYWYIQGNEKAFSVH